MRNKQNNNEVRDDGTYVVKKSKKSSILAFILCLLAAFVIWAYATATENDEVSSNMVSTETVAE